MITESTIYWITRLDYINLVFGILTFLTAFMIVVGIVVLLSNLFDRYGFNETNEEERLKIFLKVVKTTFFIPLTLVFSILVLVFLPTTKEMCAIKVIPAIANNKNLNDLGNGLVDLAKEWISELKPNNIRKNTK